MKTKQFITFSLSAGDRKTFKKLCDEYWFFLWFITKDRLNYCWIVSTSKSCWGHLSCGCWVCNGMSSQAAVQVWASLPLLVLVLWVARSFWLPPCAPTLLSTRTTSEGFVPTPQRCTACQLGISLCFFFFFWFVFPCPVSQEQKYLLSCTARVPKAVGSCTGTEKRVFGRNGLCHVWIL